MTELSSVLSKVGFTEDELKVYEVVVGFGFRTIGQVTSYTSLSYKQVSDAATSLVTKNYLKKIVGKTEIPSIVFGTSFDTPVNSASVGMTSGKYQGKSLT